MSIRGLVTVAVLAAASLTFTACGKAEKSAGTGEGATTVAGAGHSHEGWWCNEHGVPEEVCALCSTKLVPDFKAKGDWCEEHNRPESQCFICHPEKEAEFAALYEAKYGEQPPKPTAYSAAASGPHEHHDHK